MRLDGFRILPMGDRDSAPAIRAVLGAIAAGDRLAAERYRAEERIRERQRAAAAQSKAVAAAQAMQKIIALGLTLHERATVRSMVADYGIEINRAAEIVVNARRPASTGAA